MPIPKLPLGCFTQVPDRLIDNLHRMSPSAGIIAVVICRQSFGLFRPSVKMSIAKLKSSTGLAGGTIVSSVRELIEKGFLTRVRVGKSFIYTVVIKVKGEA